MGIPPTSRTFGFLHDGESVEAWTLCGQGGLVLEIITYGATVTRLLAPDRDGRLVDVVLGFNNLDSYLADRAYIGAIIGRVAGRIPEPALILKGKHTSLPGTILQTISTAESKDSTRKSGQLRPWRTLAEHPRCA